MDAGRDRSEGARVLKRSLECAIAAKAAELSMETGCGWAVQTVPSAMHAIYFNLLSAILNCTPPGKALGGSPGCMRLCIYHYCIRRLLECIDSVCGKATWNIQRPSKSV